MKNIKKYKKLQLLGTLVILAVISGEVQAISRCRVSLNRFDFGLYYPMQSGHLDVTGTMRVRCQGGPGNYSIGIDAGSSGSITRRAMQENRGGGGGRGQGNMRVRGVLEYNFFIDAARSIVWGDITGPNVIMGRHTQRSSPRGEIINFHGRVFSNQDPEPGRYRDRLTVTIQF